MEYKKEIENRDFSTSTVRIFSTVNGYLETDVNVWDLMTNLIENQTEDLYFVDKLEELKSELELHIEEKE